MKQCISKLIHLISYLWRTLKTYVRRRVKVRDVTGDNKVDILITNDPKWYNDCEVDPLTNNNLESQEGDIDYDR